MCEIEAFLWQFKDYQNILKNILVCKGESKWQQMEVGRDKMTTLSLQRGEVELIAVYTTW